MLTLVLPSLLEIGERVQGGGGGIQEGRRILAHRFDGPLFRASGRMRGIQMYSVFSAAAAATVTFIPYCTEYLRGEVYVLLPAPLFTTKYAALLVPLSDFTRTLPDAAPSGTRSRISRSDHET